MPTSQISGQGPQMTTQKIMIILPRKLLFVPKNWRCIYVKVQLFRVEARLFQKDLAMLLNEPTWVATSTYKDIIDGIASDTVPPAHIILGDGLREPRDSMTKVSKEDGNDKRT
jgi:hypothetical protein